jgi:glyoxylase-like metal-dependent hydrolase (beta-lactamase superfamily II)
VELKTFFDSYSYTLTYVVFDSKTLDAVVIDPVWDYDPNGSVVSRKSFDELSDFLISKKLKLHFILETHAHADHLSSSQLLKQKFPGSKVAIGEKIKLVQQTFKKVFNLHDDFPIDGSQFDQLLHDHDVVRAGSLEFRVIPTPGHTPACVSYLFGKMLFTGDAIFMPDYGTGRCDFPAGSSEVLYDSITKNIFSLPDDTRIFVGHDYQPGGRDLQYESTVGKQKAGNIQLNGSTTRSDFVKFRSERDKKLAAPRLLLPSVQVNIDAGHLPKAENNGKRYLKIPITEK